MAGLKKIKKCSTGSTLDGIRQRSMDLNLLGEGFAVDFFQETLKH